MKNTFRLVGLLLVLGMLFAPPVQASSTWNIQTIDTSTTVFGYCPIVVDSNNNPHIAFGVMYASWNGSAWNTQKVAGGTVFGLALDSNNNPHILLDGAENGLQYNSWTGQNWTTQTIDKNGTYFGRFGALALDSAGNPHIAYTDDGKLVKYASWTGANWNIQIVDTSQSDYAPRVSIATDSNSTVYLMYGSSADVKLAVYKDSNWTIQTIASNMDSLGNIVLDSKGYPRLIYAHDYSEAYRSDSAIVYVSWNGAAWITQRAVSNVTTGGVGTRTGFFTMGYLSLDSHDTPHIAYVNNFSSIPSGWGNLVFSIWTGKIWYNQTVNSTIVAQSCYLELDSNGNPHISFLGVVEGSEAAMLTGAYSWISPVMYATAEMSPVTEQIGTSIFTAVAIVSVVAVAAVAGLFVYFKKRKSKEQLG